ncbi:MAG: flagellar protein FlaG [Planctomycetota bacterium]
MSSIEMNVATQVGDVNRPQQHQRDRQEQQAAAQASDTGDESKIAVQSITADEVRSAAAELQQVIEVASGRELAFDIFEDTASLFVEISDRSSGEVIKQIPSEEVLQLRTRIQELVGVLVNEQA